MLIAFTGKAGAGKDTAAAALVRRGFKLIRFADTLKDMVAVMLDVDRAMLEVRGFKETPIKGLGKSPRQIMQTLGTDWGRNHVCEDVWVQLAMARASRFPNVVIPDCRFDNEAAAVRAEGGVVVQIVREGVAPVAEHESERGVSACFVDYVVANAGRSEQGFIDRIGDLYDKGLLLNQRGAA